MNNHLRMGKRVRANGATGVIIRIEQKIVVVKHDSTGVWHRCPKDTVSPTKPSHEH